jgi:hypothetical protein
MQKKLWLWVWLSVVLLSVAAIPATAAIYGGGPYGTRITYLPYTIKTQGTYYLASNLTYDGAENGITVDHDDVTLDLMGFSLIYKGKASADAPNAIYMNGRNNVEIRNGSISGWGGGIYDSGGQAHRILNLRISAFVDAIFLGGDGHLIKNCVCEAAGSTVGDFIFLGTGTISDCIVKFNGGNGIDSGGGIIKDNVITGTGSGNGVRTIGNSTCSLIMGNEVSNCAVGIDCTNTSGVIGNTVNTSAASQTGIILNGSCLLDQNTVLGSGTHYSGTTTYNRNNAG